MRISKLLYRLSLAILSGHCLNTDFTGSCSTSIITCRIIPSSWWSISYCMAFIITCPWISKFWDVCPGPSTLLNSLLRLRLVMPPVLFLTLSLPMTQLAHVLFPTAMANGTISGSFVFCECNWFFLILYSTLIEVSDVIYDTMHYAYVIFLFFDWWSKLMTLILACTTRNFRRTSGSRKSTI